MKNFFKMLLRKKGYKVISLDAFNRLKERANKPAPAPVAVVNADPWPWLRDVNNFKTLVDIGANVGDFGAFIAKYFDTERAYFFEPQETCIKDIERFTAELPHKEIFCTALSDESGYTDFNVTNANASSSIMKLSDVHLRNFPQVQQCDTTKVKLARLDDLLKGRDMPGDLFIKIDVQGYECKVIEGGRETFKRAKGVLVEMSFSEIYENQPLFHEVHMMLHECGLSFCGIKNQISSKDFEPLFAHCLYLRD